MPSLNLSTSFPDTLPHQSVIKACSLDGTFTTKSPVSLINPSEYLFMPTARLIKGGRAQAIPEAPIVIIFGALFLPTQLTHTVVAGKGHRFFQFHGTAFFMLIWTFSPGVASPVKRC